MPARKRGAGVRHPRIRVSRAPTRPDPASKPARLRRGWIRRPRLAGVWTGGHARGIRRTFVQESSYTSTLIVRLQRRSALQHAVGLDVDLGAGELGGQTGVLALLADRQRQLVVGHERADRFDGRVQDEAGGDLRRRERVRDELRQFGVVVDDVDLLAAELLGDRADPSAEFADAGALGVDRRVGRASPRSSCGARPRGRATRSRPGRRGSRAPRGRRVCGPVRVGARDGDLRALRALGDGGDVHAQARAVRVLLAGDLLFGRQDRLDRTEVDVDHAGVGTLLHDPRRRCRPPCRGTRRAPRRRRCRAVAG